MDGTTDFSALSDADLARAKALSDGVLNPRDYENVRLELARRRRQRSLARRPVVLRVLGGLLLLAALANLLTLRFLFLPPARILFPFTLLPVLLWAAAGAALLLGKRVGVTLAMVALGFQLVSFAAGGIDYSFSPLLGARLMWSEGQMLVNLRAGPHGYLRFGQDVPFRIGLDLVAAAGLLFLVRCRRAPALEARDES